MLAKNSLVRLVVLLIALSYSMALQAQDVASMTGLVTDTTGAVIPGANVELVNTATNSVYKTTTNEIGTYTIANAIPGPGYKVTFSRDGFQSVAITGLYLNVSATRTQNAKLPVGTATQSVEVSAQSENVTLNTTDGRKQL